MQLRHIISAEECADNQFLGELFALAGVFEQRLLQNNVPTLLDRKIIATLFFEPSTRTRFSFSAAALRLGASVISAENAAIASSVVKGESIEDTMRMVCSYADCIVMRHPLGGAARTAAGACSVPFINAGDGGNEHPTQALLDLYTIRKEVGRLDNLHVAFGCDPKHSRTIRSLARMLAKYPGMRFTFISPQSLQADPKLLVDLRVQGVTVTETDSLAAGIEADVLYMNRLQQERFADKTEFERYRKALILTAPMLQHSSVKILDPLPRIDEIDASVDNLPNAAYFRQAQNGLYIRMALLSMLLNDEYKNLILENYGFAETSRTN